MGRMIVKVNDRRGATIKRPPSTPLARVGAYKPNPKCLIIIPFWEADRGMANTLARLLADLEPVHSDRADVLMLARFDCEPDGPTIEAISKKFNVYSYISKKRMTGWPNGCNSVAFAAFEWAYFQMTNGRVPGYKFLLLLGPDTCPLSRNWLARIHHEFDSMNANKNVYVSGCLIDHPSHPHINGDAILLSGQLDFLKWLALQASSRMGNAGWDWALASQFQNWGWENIPCIKSVWNRNVPFLEHDWINEVHSAKTVLFHGQKSFSLLDMARRELL